METPQRRELDAATNETPGSIQRLAEGLRSYVADTFPLLGRVTGVLADATTALATPGRGADHATPDRNGHGTGVS